ncbi:MAG: hypothetical protein ACR2PG_06725 [Hyphomicrobiaceae bacterium]
MQAQMLGSDQLSIARPSVRMSLTFRVEKAKFVLLVHRQRQALKRLHGDMLKDLGTAPADAEVEANRSFFDVPALRRLD